MDLTLPSLQKERKGEETQVNIKKNLSSHSGRCGLASNKNHGNQRRVISSFQIVLNCNLFFKSKDQIKQMKLIFGSWPLLGRAWSFLSKVT